MTTIITRLYSNAKKANSVVAALKKEHFTDSEITVIATGSKKDADAAAYKDDILAGGVAPDAADVYAGQVADGKALVVVRAPVGRAVDAQAVVDAHEPIDAGVENTDVYVSTQKGMSVMDKTSTPASDYAHRLMVSGDALPALSEQSFPFSSKFGFELLSDTPARAELSDDDMPLSSFFKMNMLSDREPNIELSDRKPNFDLSKQNPFPMSSMLGWKLLTEPKKKKK